MKILLVRHGHTTSNQTGTFTGQENVNLTEIGKEQAKRACEYLLKTYKIDAIYSSDLVRSTDTVKGVAQELGLKINLDKSLREINGGKWEGKNTKQLLENYYEDYTAWQKDVGTARATDGENFVEVGKRAYDGLIEICKREEKLEKGDKERTLLLGTHAGVIRSLQCIINGVPFEEMGKIPWVSNASITEIEYKNGKVTELKRDVNEYLEGINTTLTVFK